MSSIWGWFLSLPLVVRIVLVIVALLLIIFAGPLWFFLSIFALIAVLIAFVVRAVQGSPLRTTGIAAAALFALMIVSCSSTAFVYGGSGEGERVAERNPRPQPVQKEEAEQTRYVTVEETVERTVTVAPDDEDENGNEEDEDRDVIVNEDGDARPAPPRAPEEDDESNDNANDDDGREDVTVASVTDGDTISISEPVEGLTDVRLIGMDTPETSFGTEPYGAEATAFTESMLSGQEVELELDEEIVDPYGRLLAYVYLPDGSMFNETLVRQGYAQVATFPPNTRYLSRFEEAQRLAQSEYAGIWALPAEQLCLLADRGNGIGGGCEAPPAPVTPVPGVDEAPVAEQDSGGATDGYYPGAPDLDCADFGGPVVVSPGDPYGLDADGDGTGCDA